ncbi:hypothetical protein HY411_01695 [Candidatus Gottesmanbacteria bacterium]|nr:hypothetical protein [Candidatus Gottesmanbacteria bacterium]
MIHPIQFTLSYKGSSADAYEIDLYDVAQALVGFQRSLALTTHLVLNGEIITQSPSLKGARILALPPRPGSWEIIAGIVLAVGAGIYKIGTAPKDTPIGHLVRSAYDYVVSETLGVPVDYDKTLRQQIETYKRQGARLPDLSVSRLDSLTEKCERAIKEMHRPIVESETAQSAQVTATIDKKIVKVGNALTSSTYQYIDQTHVADSPDTLEGRVSSYNSNTFKGRIFLKDEGRPVPFELKEEARNALSVAQVTNSLTMNARFRANKKEIQGFITVKAFKNTSKSGQLKSLTIIQVST